jgi:tetratricopeptide (TPR) repeat protein
MARAIRDRRLRPLLALVLPICLLLLPLAAHAAANPRELLNSGRADDALRLLTPLAVGNDAVALNYLGRVYFALHDWDNAVQYCERAAQIEPGNAIFQLWLGRSYGEKANATNPLVAYPLARKTVAAFIAAHSLDRGNIPIARDLAEYYAEAPAIVGGGADKALDMAAELAAAHPADAAWIRARAAANQGQYERAEHEYIEAIRLDHDSAAAYLDLARFLYGRKRWERFQQTVERAMKSARIQPTDRYDAAEMLLRAKRNLPLAAQQMRAYIQSGRTEEEAPLFRAHFLLGEILRKSGDAGKAAAEFNAALALASSYRPAAESLRRLTRRWNPLAED